MGWQWNGGLRGCGEWDGSGVGAEGMWGVGD